MSLLRCRKNTLSQNTLSQRPEAKICCVKSSFCLHHGQNQFCPFWGPYKNIKPNWILNFLFGDFVFLKYSKRKEFENFQNKLFIFKASVIFWKFKTLSLMRHARGAKNRRLSEIGLIKIYIPDRQHSARFRKLPKNCYITPPYCTLYSIHSRVEQYYTSLYCMGIEVRRELLLQVTYIVLYIYEYCIAREKTTSLMTFSYNTV